MSVLIDQEAWLAYYAEQLGVEVVSLGERDLRLALALYHAAYLPTAATVELRANELDLQQRYAEFGFEPNTPTFATGRVSVELRNAATTTYTLAAPFTVRQGDLTFIATEPLTVAAGQTTGSAAIVAQLQGEAGTPQEAAATIGPSVAWLRGAAITITDVVDGQDGGTTEEIRAAFRAFAFNPEALVRAEDHAAYAETEFDFIGRALAHARTRITNDDGTYSAETEVEGHLSLALISSSGGQPTDEQVAEVKEGLLRLTVPYGEDALHVVKAAPMSITGTITVTVEPGVDHDDLKALIADAVNDFLDWRTWPTGRDVHAGDMWRVIDAVENVRYVNSVVLQGPNGDVTTLQPWQYPEGGFTTANVQLIEAS
jgi:hypothetical protein